MQDFVDLPQRLKDVLEEAGVMDAVPWDGRLAGSPKGGTYLTEEDMFALEQLNCPDPVDDEEGARLEEAQLRAVRKIEAMLSLEPSVMDKVEAAFFDAGNTWERSNSLNEKIFSFEELCCLI